MDAVNDIDSIRKITGVCPQHDILWNELTGREHLTIFAQLKDIHRDQITEQVDGILEQIGLTAVADDRWVYGRLQTNPFLSLPHSYPPNSPPNKFYFSPIEYPPIVVE
jgi:hypothetical protein